jgi:hypothetical protein
VVLERFARVNPRGQRRPSSLNGDRAAHAGLQVSTLQAGKGHGPGTREFPDQLAALAGRKARHVGSAVLDNDCTLMPVAVAKGSM